MTFKLSGTETCSKKEFIVEVIGQSHNDTQSVCLSIDNKRYSPAEESVISNRNSLSIWQAKSTSASAKIIIKTEQGDVSLPTFDRVYPSTRCEKWHRDIIAPFIPLVKVGSNNTGVVHARDGFLYIFMGKKIWREISIGFGENGLPSYKDTLLTKIRAEDVHAAIPSEYERPAIGLHMDAIWLPVRNSDRWGGLLSSEKPQVFYSEVQLSAERLAKLESNQDLLKKRCENLYLNEPGHSHYVGRLIKLSAIGSQRSRSKQGIGETSLADPVAYLHNLEGTYFSELLDLASNEITQLETSGPFGDAYADHLKPRVAPRAGEGSTLLPENEILARKKALGDSVFRPAPNSSDTPQLDDSELWQSHGQAKDIFSKTRENGYVGLLLTDVMFDLRQNIEIASLGLQYVNELQQYISRHKHFNFANYVHHLLLSPHNKTLKQYYDKYGDKIPMHPSDPLPRILLPELRKVARDSVDDAQYKAYKSITSQETIAALTDLFSLNNEDYASGHILVSNFANSILYSANGMDSFVKKAKGSKFTSLIFTFLQRTDTQDLLGSMIFPPEEEVPVNATWSTQKYDNGFKEKNEGDGRYRIHELLKLGQGKKLSDYPLQSLDVVLAASVDNSLEESNSPLGSVLGGTKRFFNDFANSVSGLVVAGQAYITYLSYDKAIRAISGKAYTNTFRLGKVFNAKHLSEVSIVSNNIPKGHVLIGGQIGGEPFGIQAQVAKAKRTHTNQVHIVDEADNLIVANQRHMLKTAEYSPSKAGKLAPRQNYVFFTAPKDSAPALASQTAKMQNSRFSEGIEKGLLKISPMLLFLELWNLQSAVQVSKDPSSSRNIRNIFSVAGSVLDVALTLERTLALIHNQNIVTRSLSSIIIPTGRAYILANTLPSSLLNRIAQRLLPKVATSYAIGGLSGIITAGVYIADARNDWRQGDNDAAIANGIAAFASAGATGSLIAGAFGIGLAVPAFWIFFVVGAIAGGLAMWLDDDDIELLLINGPLGREPNMSRYGHLHQPNEAYYRLISYLITPRFSLSDFDKNERTNWQRGTSLDLSNRFDKKVNIELPFPNWFDLSDYRIDFKLTREEQRYNERHGMFSSGTPKKMAMEKPIFKLSDQGISAILTLPESEISKGGIMSSMSRTEFALQIKLQLLAKQQVSTSQQDQRLQTWVFPAPSVDANLGITQKDKTPDFSNEKQVYWYSHKWEL